MAMVCLRLLLCWEVGLGSYCMDMLIPDNRLQWAKGVQRGFAEKRMLEYKDASNFPFRGDVVNEDDSDLYKKDDSRCDD